MYSFARDLGRREAVGDQLQHLFLALGDQPLLAELALAGFGQHQLGELGRQREVAVGGHPTGIGDLGHRAVLREVPDRPGLDRPVDDVAVHVHRQHDDPLPGVGLHDRPGRLDPVDVGHRHVHQDHVGLALQCQLQRLVAVARLGHDDESFGLECPAQPLSKHAVVIDQHQAQAHAFPSRFGTHAQSNRRPCA